MPLRFTCPRCHAVLAAPDAATGRHGVCPRCQSTIEAPGQDEPTAPVAPAAPVPICPHCGKAYDAPVQLRRAPRVRRLWPAVVGAALVLGAVFLLSGFLGGLHHGEPAAGVDGKHLDIEAHGGRDGFGHRVRDVVELEVEKDRTAGGADAADDVRAGAGEEFLADLERAHDGRELFGELKGLFHGGNIQGNDDWILHRGD